MYSLVSRFFGFVAGSSDEDFQEDDKNNDQNTTSEVEGKTRPRPTPCQLEEAPPVSKNEGKDEINILSDNKELNKRIYGEITSLFSGRGLINDHIYFSKDCIIGFEKLQIGDKVSVEASRTNPQAGWIADRVTMVNEWKIEESDGESIDEILGIVTYYMNGSGLINEKHSFSRELCSEGYIPIVNDFVKCEVKTSGDMEEVLSVQPVREMTFVGVITDTINRYGFIDHDTYFHVSTCADQYHPTKGDHVNVTAIESKQRRSNWRAIKVEKLEQDQSVQIEQDTKLKGKYVEMLLKPKDGLCLEGHIDFGDVNSGSVAAKKIVLRNDGLQPFVLKKARLFRSNKQIGFIYSQEDNSEINASSENSMSDIKALKPGTTIGPGEEKFITVRLKAEFLGKFENIAVLNFGDFKIGCRLFGNIYDPIQTGIGPKTAFSFRATGDLSKSNERFDSYKVLPGQRPLRKKKAFLPKHLQMYDIPKNVRDCLMNDGPLEDLVPDLLFPLTMKSHRRKLATLLYAEEIYQEEEMRQFDMSRVTLRPMAEYLVLSVPGLAEGRPSLLIGDKVVLEIDGSFTRAPRYEGCIHEVRAEEVLLKFTESFHKMYRNEDCNVQFFFNRTPIRRNHKAIEYAANLGEEVLFPTAVKSKQPLAQTYDFKTRKEMAFVNENLNERQKVAVRRILAAHGRPTPYLLFGPPGTGKTVTLVESILQVYRRVPNSRILACAPSNSASDLIAQRLLESAHFSKGELIRLNAFQRGLDIHEVLLPYCTNDTDDLMLSCRYRIIVTTCSMSGILYSAGLESGHFTHVFVDEAGQATEAECLIPIGMIAGNQDGLVVLAGDPYQLGPVLSSPIAIEYGMNVSLLERLISRPIYERDESQFKEYGAYNPLLVTKLVENYRSHEALLNLSSSVFYHGELKARAPPDITDRFLQCSLLPTKDFPIIFHGIRGEDTREGNSPSWFNPSEAVQVLKYVQFVTSLSHNKITLDDIGIIVPYRKQVEKIRLLLERVNMEDIKVGSVEEFQGQERQVIIISTVRSNESFISFDNRHALGFLSNPKRFNVAVTRAQALLIVLGNPHILSLDPYWCSLIQYCVAHSAFIGCDLPSLDNPVIKNNFLKALQLLGVSANQSDASIVESTDDVAVAESS